jgi:hypothetical protein
MVCGLAEAIRSLSGALWADALPAWRSVRGVCGRLARWRRAEPTLYADAYVADCLPKLLAPYVRHQVPTPCLFLSIYLYYNCSTWYIVNYDYRYLKGGLNHQWPNVNTVIVNKQFYILIFLLVGRITIVM